jgi:mono/diheme cytochrome c family protein
VFTNSIAGSLLGLSAILIAGCATEPESPRGFRLPDGDAAAGRVFFVELGCNTCHTVAGVELEAPRRTGPVMLALGGPTTRIKTYGELVSSIINPSHKLIRNIPADAITIDGESLMVIYNEILTVQQLIDLVAFLQAQYEVTIPQYSYYSYKY